MKKLLIALIVIGGLAASIRTFYPDEFREQIDKLTKFPPAKQQTAEVEDDHVPATKVATSTPVTSRPAAPTATPRRLTAVAATPRPVATPNREAATGLKAQPTPKKWGETSLNISEIEPSGLDFRRKK